MSHLKPNDTLEDHYRVESFLDKGGMAEVYVVIDTRLDIRLALKIISSTIDITPKYKRMFRSEAKRHAQLLHEGIPQIKDFFIHDNQFCIVMEFVEGIDFERMLKTASKPFKVETVLDWADQILDTLEYIHGVKVVHRDIKPSNFKITPRNRIKLLDFGIAHGTIGDMTEVDTRTIAAASQPYVSIEQGVKLKEWKDTLSAISDRHRQKVDELSELTTHPAQDIFSLGATLYYLLTKEIPMQANLRAIAIWDNRADPLVPLRELNPDVPPEVAEIIMNALALEREKRPASANRMSELLREARREIEQRAEQNAFAERLADEIEKLDKNWSKQLAELSRNYEEELSYAQKALEEKQKELDLLNTDWSKQTAKNEQLFRKKLNRLETDLKNKRNDLNALNDTWLEQVAELRRNYEEELDATQGHLDHLQKQFDKQVDVTVKIRREVEVEKQRTDKARTELAANKNVSFVISQSLRKAHENLSEAQQENVFLKQQFNDKPDRFKSGLLAGLLGMGVVSTLGGLVGYQTYIKPAQVSNYSQNTSAKMPTPTATPTRTPTATPTPTPTPVPVYDIPEIEGTAGDITLSEGGKNGETTDNIFATFIESKTRYVYFDLDITHKQFAVLQKIQLKERWFKSGKLLDSYEQTVEIKPEATSTKFAYGYGQDFYGHLKSGDYEVAIVYKGKVIASKKFSIVKK